MGQLLSLPYIIVGIGFIVALGKQFEGKAEGINLQESAVGVNNETDSTFTPDIYTESLKTNMLALKKAFPKSTTMQYANYMPGEWLPWEDKGYLRSIYLFGQQIGRPRSNGSKKGTAQSCFNNDA